MKLIQYNVTPPQQLSGKLPPVTVREFKGMNTFDPLSIPENFWTVAENLTSDDYPTVSTRNGYTVLGSAIGTKVLGIGVWKDTELHAVFNDGTWRKWTGSAWSAALASGLSTTAEWSFTNFQGSFADINLIGSNGVDAIKTYNGSTVANLSGAPAGGNYITTYQNRLWCAVGIEVMSCALDQPTVWNDFSGDDSDSYVKTMESTRGENVNMLSGGLSKLTIGMPNSLHELYGGVPSDFNTHVVTEDEGVANNKSVITQKGLMRFMHRTGIYDYAGGVLPSTDFADVVGTYYSTISTSAAAGSDGDNLYFRTDTDTTLVYDPRSGINTWHVWRNIQPICFAQFKGDFYIGDNLGRVLKVSGSTDNGTAITWKAVTKPLNLPTMVQQQRWYKAWLAYELASGATLTISLSKSLSGDSDWVVVQNITGTGAPGIQRVLIPVGQFALENWVRIKLSGTGWVKIHEITRQMRQMPLY